MNGLRPLSFILGLASVAAFAQQPPTPHCGELNVLTVGDMAPPFSAMDIAGTSLDLRALTKDKQVVLFFYRGEWCPYCTNYMAELQKHMAELTAKNAVVIAVSPEVEASAMKAVETSGATFHVVHDTGYAIMCAYGTAYELGAEKKEKYKGYGIDLQATYGNTDGVLPVPATFIIGTDGRIKALHFDPNYRERMPIKEILKAL